jgi:hypothetical protein
MKGGDEADAGKKFRAEFGVARGNASSMLEAAVAPLVGFRGGWVSCDCATRSHGCDAVLPH